MNHDDLDRLRALLDLLPLDLSMRKNWGFHQLMSGGRVWLSDGEQGIWSEEDIEATQGRYNLAIDFVASCSIVRVLIAEYEAFVAEVDEDE